MHRAQGEPGIRPAAGVTRRRGRLTLLYVGLWALLALTAVVYLAVLAIRPDAASALFTGILPGTPEPNQGQRAMTRALAEVDGLKQSVTQLRADVGSVKESLAQRDDQDRAVSTLRTDVLDLRTALAEHEERERALSGRLAAVEGQQSGSQSGTAPQTAAITPFIGVGGSLGGTTVLGHVEEPAKRAPKRTGQTAEAGGAKSEQHAAASAVPGFSAVKVKPAGPSGLQLASAATFDELKLSWLKLTASHGDALLRFEPRYMTIKNGGTASYRLIVGPIANPEEATRLCAQLKARKVACVVALYTGQPL